MSLLDPVSQRHAQLSDDEGLPVDDRYRQLAALHIVSCDFRLAVQAMWSSTLNLTEYLSLEEVSKVVGQAPAPLWLSCSGEAANYPRCEKGAWLDPDGLAEHHRDISEMAISDRVRSIHGAAYYVLTGQYGFAIQCLKSAQSVDESLSIEQLAAGDVTVDEDPDWLRCWE